jgi:hypothetical protein
VLQKNILLPFSRLRIKPRKKPAEAGGKLGGTFY